MIAHLLLLLVASFLGGALNAAAGGGTFLTLPALTIIGVSPVAANATSTAPLLPGYVASTWGFREELRTKHNAGLGLMIVTSFAGGAAGAALLLVTNCTNAFAGVALLRAACSPRKAICSGFRSGTDDMAAADGVEGALIEHLTAVNPWKAGHKRLRDGRLLALIFA